MRPARRITRRPLRGLIRFLAPALLLPALLVLLPSCSDDPSGPDAASTLNAYIRGINTFPDPPDTNDGSHRVADVHSVEDTTTEGRFLCTTTDYTMDANMDDVAVFNINAVSLWPGAIVQGQDVKHGVLNLIALPRAPLRVGTDLAGLSAEENSKVVTDPTHLGVNGAVQEIAQAFLAHNTSIPAKLSYHETFAETYEQAMLDLGISVSWSGWGDGSVQSDFASSSEEYTSSYYCRFSQTYFTASAQPPASAAAMFADGVTPEQCDPYMADGNPPCWVSSVTYGRIGILVMHSSYSREDMRLAVQAAFSGFGWDLDSDLNAFYQQVLANSEIKVLILGGNATDGVQAILGDPVAGLRTWIENGAELTQASQGLPISYTVNYLKDNRLASFGYATEWSTESCLPVSRRFNVDITHMYCWADDDGSDSTLEVYYNFWLYRQLPGQPWETLRHWELGACNSYDMSNGTTSYPDASLSFDMPDLVGARFYLSLKLDEDDGDCDSGSYDDAIGWYNTGLYEYPLWREPASDCSYPDDWGTPGGTPAVCGQGLSNSGMGINVYWSVSQEPVNP